MLRLEGVAAGYAPVQVLLAVSLEVGENEIVCLIGSNGAGKTTLLRAISGIVKSWSGTIEFNGENLSALPAYDVITRGVAHVPEGRRLFRTMSVRDNLLMGAYRARENAAVRDDLERVFTLFPILAERSGQAAGTLSGGEQQMCAIGRALMSKPKLLLIDELSLGLAPRVVDMLADTLVQVRNHGISILLVEQDVTGAFELSARGVLHDTGRMAVAAKRAELSEHPHVKLAYLGV